MWYKCAVCCVLFGLIWGTAGFPDGAPVDACVKPRPNQPYHGQSRPQPPETNPFQVIQSQAEYGPGTQISGEIILSTFKFLEIWFILNSFNFLFIQVISLPAKTINNKLVAF